MFARRLSLPVLVLASFTCTAALADQCAYLSPELADRAIWTLVLSSRKALDYCEPCGDPRPARPYLVTSVEIRDTGYESYSEVLVNGQQVDLAYLFLKTGAFTWTNAAALVGCETHDVSRKLFLPRLKAAFAPRQSAVESLAD